MPIVVIGISLGIFKLANLRKIRLLSPSGNAVEMGGDAPISIQTMWKESLVGANLSEIAERLESLAAIGCDIVRFAVPDMESADALSRLARMSRMPLVADIHFNYKLALRCLEGGVAKIRINPGNIGSKERIRAVVAMAKERGVPIRIGVNGGSLPKDLLSLVEAGKMSRASALVEAAAREVSMFEEAGFKDTVVSMKASSVEDTIACNEQFASRFDIPLHIGVTEAGPLIAGIVKSTLALSALIKNGIGSTVRVSLSDTPESEVIAAREILSECGAGSSSVKIVSCPRCGRLGFDVHAFVERWQPKLYAMKKDITVAVMGCVVNGPGEGRDADIGITGVDNTIIIFRKGEVVKKLSILEDDNSSIDRAFEEELVKL